MIIIMDISCVITINSCIAWLSMVYGHFIGTFSCWLAPHLSHISFKTETILKQQDTDVLTAFISLVCVKLFNVNQNKGGKNKEAVSDSWTNWLF